MLEPRAIHRLDGQEFVRVYTDIREKCPRYFEVAGFESPAAFAFWATTENVYVLEFESGLVFLTEWRPRISVRIHPVVWGKKAVVEASFGSELLERIRSQCRVERVEALVEAGPKHGLERWAVRLGMELEGRLRRAFVKNGRVSDAFLFSYIGAQHG